MIKESMDYCRKVAVTLVALVVLMQFVRSHCEGRIDRPFVPLPPRFPQDTVHKDDPGDTLLTDLATGGQNVSDNGTPQFIGLCAGGSSCDANRGNTTDDDGNVSGDSLDWFQRQDAICGNDISAWSCRGRCGDQRTAIPCSCHSACRVHHMCCLDFASRCVEEHRLATELAAAYPQASAVCDPTVNRMLISDCPSDTPVTLRTHCRKAASWRLISDFRPPVTDAKYQWSFKNMDCWLCWMKFGDAIPWPMEMHINVSESDTTIFLPTNMRSNFTVGKNLIPEPPEGVLDFQCVNSSEVVGPEDCGENVPSEVKSLCGETFSQVKAFGKVFRNVYCVECFNTRFTLITLNMRPCEFIPPVVKPELSQDMYPVTLKRVAKHSRLSPQLMTYDSVDLTGSGPLVKWRQLLCRFLVCTVVTCQLGVANMANNYCHDSLYVWTLAMKLCVVDGGGPHDRTSSCDPNGNKDLLLASGLANTTTNNTNTKGLTWMGLYDAERSLLPNVEKYVLDVGSNAHTLNVHSTYNYTLEEVQSEFYSNFVVTTANDVLDAVHQGKRNAKVESKVLVDSDRQEFYLVVVVLNEGQLLELPALYHHLSLDLGRKLWPRPPFPFLKLCKHAMPGLSLDLDVMAQETACDVISVNCGPNGHHGTVLSLFCLGGLMASWLGICWLGNQ